MSEQFQDRFERLQHIVCGAVALPSNERDRYIEASAAGDAGLAREATRLVRKAASIEDEGPLSDAYIDEQRRLAESLFEKPAGRDGSPSLERIGRYRVIREIARGSMGVVYECEQERPARRVAVKTLEGPWRQDSVAHRLKREAELLGQLRHPGIAHVYEAGDHDTPFGRIPFFAMELINGLTLDQYVKTHALPPRKVVELVIRIAEALDYAHKHGVIHRDLKPSNVIVRADGSPKLLDFGVSLSSQSRDNALTLRTEAGAVLGTLRYMPPEQAGGDSALIDVRSDIYALGAVAFELLTAHALHDLTDLSIASALQQIQLRDRRTLSAVDRSLAGDLELIIAKATERDPDRRYQTASEFAADLRRYLSSQPIHARPPSFRYQAAQFVKRHTAPVVAAALILLSVVAGSAVAVAFAVESRRSEARTAEALAQIQAVTTYQEQQFRRVDPARFGVLLREKLGDRLAGGATPLDQVNFTDLSKDTFEDSFFASSLDAIQTQFQSDPVTRAQLLQSLASTMLELNMFGPASEAQDLALTVRRATLGPAHPDTLRSEVEAVVLKLNSESVERPIAAAEALDLYDKLCDRLGDRHPITLDLLARSVNYIYDAADPGLARRLAEAAVADAEVSHGPEADTTVRLKIHLAWMLDDLGDTSGALEFATQAARSSPDSRSETHIWALEVLSGLLWKAGRLEEAEPICRQARRFASDRYGATHARTIACGSLLVAILEMTGRFEEAERIARANADASVAVFGTHFEASLTAIHNLGFVQYRAGKLNDAEKNLRLSLEGRRRLMPDDETTLANAGNLSLVLTELGRLDEAETLAAAAYKDAAESFGDDNWVTANIGWQLAYCQANLGCDSGWIESFENSYRAFEAAFGASHSRTRDLASRALALINHCGCAEPAAPELWRSRAE